MFINKLQQVLGFAEKWLAGISLGLLVILTVIQAIARNGFNTGFSDLEILSRHLVLFIMFSGAALVTTDRRHIKIDILKHLLPSACKRILAVIIYLISASICFLLAWYAAHFWIEEWHYASGPEQWPLFLALIIPLGFLSIGTHFLLMIFAPVTTSDTANH